MDAEQFEALYRATARDVFSYVRRRTVGEAEDIVAETYAVAWRRRADLPAPPHRRAWLFGVARTLLAAQQRVTRSQREMVGDLAATLGREPAGPTAPTRPRARCAEVVAAALERLSATEREAITLAVWEGLTVAEVAVALEIRPGTARVRLHRARRSLAGDSQVRALLPETGATARPVLAEVSAPGAG